MTLSRLRAALAPLRGRTPLLLLVCFIVTDLGFICLHLAQKTVGLPEAPTFDLGVDRSYSDVVLILKWLWIALAALELRRVRRAPVFVAIALGCIVLIVEDGLSVHETLGMIWGPGLRERFDLPWLVAAQAVELAWLAVLCAVIGVAFLVGLRRSDRGARIDALVLAGFFLVFAVSAALIDTVHSFFPMGTPIDTALTTLEEGTEIVSMSFAVAYAFALVAATERDRPSVPAAAEAA